MDVTDISAEELMEKEVQTVNESTTLLAAAKLLRDSKVSSLVVVPKNARDAWGIVTRKDIVEALIEESLNSSAQIVADVLSKPALTVEPSLSVLNCWQIMRMVGVRRLPVVNNGQLVGIISNSDLFDALASEIRD